MATIFPLSPEIGDQYQGYEWDGTAWQLIGMDFTIDYAPASDLAAHEAATTSVHGITDTSALETTSGSQSKANAAQAAAEAYADSLASNYDAAGAAASALVSANSYTDTEVGAAVPSQVGQTGKYLYTNGTLTSWETIGDSIPTQTGNAGKVLTTNGSAASWANDIVNGSTDYAQLYLNGGSSQVLVHGENASGSYGEVQVQAGLARLRAYDGTTGGYLTIDSSTGDLIIDSSGSVQLPAGTTFGGSAIGVAALPSQSSKAGFLLATDGTNAFWSKGITYETVNGYSELYFSSDGLGANIYVQATDFSFGQAYAGNTQSGVETWAADGVTGGDFMIKSDGGIEIESSNYIRFRKWSDNTNSILIDHTTGDIIISPVTSLQLPAGTLFGGSTLATAAFPTQTGNGGKYLTTDGSSISWATISGALPDQTGNSGKYLTTDGTTASWATVSGGGGGGNFNIVDINIQQLTSNFNAASGTSEQEVTGLRVTLPIVSGELCTIRTILKMYLGVPSGDNSIRLKLGSSTDHTAADTIDNLYFGGAQERPTAFGQAVFATDLSTQKYLFVTVQNGTDASGLYMSSSGYRTALGFDVYQAVV